MLDCLGIDVSNCVSRPDSCVSYDGQLIILARSLAHLLISLLTFSVPTRCSHREGKKARGCLSVCASWGQKKTKRNGTKPSKPILSTRYRRLNSTASPILIPPERAHLLFICSTCCVCTCPRTHQSQQRIYVLRQRALSTTRLRVK